MRARRQRHLRTHARTCGASVARVWREAGGSGRRGLVLALVLLVSFACAQARVPGGALRRARQEATPMPRASRQLIVVTTQGWETVAGRLRRYERRNAGDSWHEVGEPFEVVVGKHGLGWGVGLHRVEAPAAGPFKREGDGKSPAGVFRLVAAFGSAASAQASNTVRLPYLPLDAGTECVDDVRSQHYNRIVERTRVPAVDWQSSERMLDVGEQYRWGLLVAHNYDPPRPGGGSCIFLHIWAGPAQGTAGCTAMPRTRIEELLRWLDAARRPVLVQLPAAEYERRRASWRLPALD